MIYITIKYYQNEDKSEYQSQNCCNLEEGVPKFNVAREMASQIKLLNKEIYWEALTKPMWFVSSGLSRSPFEEAVQTSSYRVISAIFEKLSWRKMESLLNHSSRYNTHTKVKRNNIYIEEAFQRNPGN